MSAPPRLFDRDLLRLRLDRAAPGYAAADFLKRRAAEDAVVRLEAIMREFPLAVDLGARNGAFREALAMSASEAHASVKRAVASGLAVAPARGEWSPVRPSLLEFVLHGARYVWPTAQGPVKRGVPTAFGTEPLASQLTTAPGEAPVWAHPAGIAKGPTLTPLYRTAPQAALADPALHRLLALLDALRAVILFLDHATQLLQLLLQVIDAGIHLDQRLAVDLALDARHAFLERLRPRRGGAGRTRGGRGLGLRRYRLGLNNGRQRRGIRQACAQQACQNRRHRPCCISHRVFRRSNQ